MSEERGKAAASGRVSGRLVGARKRHHLPSRDNSSSMRQVGDLDDKSSPRGSSMTNIGVLGFGEAGSAFAAALAGHGAVVRAFDPARDQLDIKLPQISLAGDVKITFCSLAELLASSEIILSTVTTDAALTAAQNCVPNLGPQHIYCDLNSTAPALKLQLHELIQPTSAIFVEGAILGAIGVTGAMTKILLGGAYAEELSKTLSKYGLNTAPYSRDIGKASTFKMLRSIFSKGLEALMVEFLLAGKKAGLEDDLWQEVTTLLAENSFDDVARNWVCSHGVAHKRRYHEMAQVSDLLSEMNVEAIMTDATTAFFKRSNDLDLSQDFVGKPDRMDDVIEALLRRVSQKP